jgi:hypothetical protein
MSVFPITTTTATTTTVTTTDSETVVQLQAELKKLQALVHGARFGAEICARAELLGVTMLGLKSSQTCDPKACLSGALFLYTGTCIAFSIMSRR